MDVITIESKAYKEIVAKIDVIANYVFSQEDTKNEDEIWVDSYEVCTFLQISDRTLQRLRAKGVVAFSNIGGRCYYKIGELKRLLEERLIKSNFLQHRRTVLLQDRRTETPAGRTDDKEQ